MQVAVFLALIRLVWLMITSIVALSRLDQCLFTIVKGRDRGYASFLAMALMLHAFQVLEPTLACLFSSLLLDNAVWCLIVPRRHPLHLCFTAQVSTSDNSGAPWFPSCFTGEF